MSTSGPWADSSTRRGRKSPSRRSASRSSFSDASSAWTAFDVPALVTMRSTIPRASLLGRERHLPALTRFHQLDRAVDVAEREVVGDERAHVDHALLDVRGHLLPGRGDAPAGDSVQAQALHDDIAGEIDDVEPVADAKQADPAPGPHETRRRRDGNR